MNKPDLINHLKIQSDDEELVLGDVTTLFIGGFHTTGNLLSWMFYYLAIHQDIQNKVFQELKSNLGDKDMSFEDIPKLKYCSQVIEETLRLSVTAPFAARISSEDITVLGHNIPANTPIGKSIVIQWS